MILNHGEGVAHVITNLKPSIRAKLALLRYPLAIAGRHGYHVRIPDHVIQVGGGLGDFLLHNIVYLPFEPEVKDQRSKVKSRHVGLLTWWVWVCLQVAPLGTTQHSDP